MTDVALTKGLPYDNFHQADHFFADHFRQYCDGCLRDGRFLGIEEFAALFKDNSTLTPVLRFFDGLTRNEERFRWDRLVAFHLLLMAFINSFGYKRQYSKDADFARAAMQIRNLRVLENLVEWLPRHDLDRDREARRIVRAAKEVRTFAGADAGGGVRDRVIQRVSGAFQLRSGGCDSAEQGAPKSKSERPVP